MTRTRILAVALLAVWFGAFVGSEDATGQALSGSSTASAPDSAMAAAFKARRDAIRALMTDQTRLAELEQQARDLLADVERDLGPESGEAGRALDLILQTRWRQGLLDSATTSLGTRAIRVKEAAFGAESPEVAISVTLLGIVKFLSGDYEEALALHERALAIRLASLGPDDYQVGVSLASIGSVYYAKSALPEARERYLRAAEIFEKTKGPESSDYATALQNVTNVEADLGEYESALAGYKKAIAICEKTLGPEHPYVGENLANLASTYTDLGDYATALPLYERAIAIEEKALGAEHPTVAFTMANLGNLLQAMGEYGRARIVLERAVAIQEKALGPDHPDLAATLNNLGDVLSSTGSVREARALYARANEIFLKSLGAESSRVAANLSDLGVACLALGDTAAARDAYGKALAIWEDSLGPEHPKVALALVNLADVVRHFGEVDRARAMMERAITIWTASLGPDSDPLAFGYHTLGNLELQERRPDAARDDFERALAIRGRALGPEHPRVAKAMVELAETLADLGETDSAFVLALRGEAIGRASLRETVRTLPERQALDYLAVRASGLGLALSLAAAARPADPDMTTDAWDALVRSRGVVLDEMASRHRSLARANETAAASLAEVYSAAQQRTANLVIRGPGERAPSRYRALVDSSRAEAERAERELLAASATFRIERAQSHAGLADVLDALPDATSLVAYARIEPRSDGVEQYLAFAAGGEGGPPHMVPLGDAAMIDSLVARWRAEAGSQLTSGDGAERDEACRVAGTRLREAIWDPIVSRFGTPRHVLLVPDGALGLVNFGALPIGDSEYVIERGPVLHVLSAERDVIGAGGAAHTGRGLLALGDPEYDLAPGDAMAASGLARVVGATATVAMASSAEGFRGARARCPEFDRLRWDRLAGTAREIDEAMAHWTAKNGAPRPPDAASSDEPEESLRLVGPDATEGAFKTRARGWRVLHLATHGFFLGDDCASDAGSSPPARGIGGYISTTPAASPESAPAPANPLQFSGLVLAGANARARAAQGEEDGILTAEEIAALDLSDAEWVVLSACDTGLGRIQAGEGVFGLRRAIQIAGAGTTIMSLWPVGDMATREWMGALYEARFVDGLATDEAVRAASLARLHAQRARGAGSHPSVWAPFIAAGNWR